MMYYAVRYYDNTGTQDVISEYATEGEAEAAIAEELEEQKAAYSKQSLNYDYSDFPPANTELWVSGGNEYAVWARLWKLA